MIHPVIEEDMQTIHAEAINWEKLSDSVFLISGAYGLIPSYLCRTLIWLNDNMNLKIKVLALARNKEKAHRLFGKLLDREDIHLIIQDVREPVKYDGHINYIIHGASKTAGFLKDPVGVIGANVIGTERLLDLAVKKKSRFMYLSTREIYGRSVNDGRLAKENDIGIVDPVEPRSCYAESKRLGEALCVAFRRQFGVESCSVRLDRTYGPCLEIKNGRVWGDFINNVICNQNIILKSNGLDEIVLTYVTDTVTGLFRVLINGTQQTYNISNNAEIITVRGLAEKLCAMYPERNIGVEYKIPKNGGEYLLHQPSFMDTTKIVLIGWKSKINLEQGFRRTVLYQETR